jgi:hypothetical protein
VLSLCYPRAIAALSLRYRCAIGALSLCYRRAIGALSLYCLLSLLLAGYEHVADVLPDREAPRETGRLHAVQANQTRQTVHRAAVDREVGVGNHRRYSTATVITVSIIAILGTIGTTITTGIAVLARTGELGPDASIVRADVALSNGRPVALYLAAEGGDGVGAGRTAFALSAQHAKVQVPLVMEWWDDGVVEWFSGGVVEWWSGGMVEWWSGGAVECLEWWSGGVVVWWSGGVVEWWSGGVK